MGTSECDLRTSATRKILFSNETGRQQHKGVSDILVARVVNYPGESFVAVFFLLAVALRNTRSALIKHAIR